MIDINWSDPDTLWLNVTNLALGIVTLLCCLLCVYAVAKEVWVRRAKTSKDTILLDDHSFRLAGGWTMADGGQRESDKRRK